MHILPINNKGDKINDSSYQLFFDSAGNAYIMKNNKVYQILIESNNNISLIYDAEFIFHPYDSNIKNMKLSTDPSSLKGKIIKNKINEEDDQNNSDDEDDLTHQLYPEDDDYYQDDENNDDIDDSFDFSLVNAQDNNIKIYDTDEYTAIYDSIVYNGSYYSNNNIIFKTNYTGYTLPYRLLIFSSGEFIIKTIGINYWYNQLSETENGEPCFTNSINHSIHIKK
jgi:hypothetical protein